ncbi:MAG TPA: glycoside hydrolase [Chitinophagaceae bacterium]|jgi:xylan 1,4-beta-xylosidase
MERRHFLKDSLALSAGGWLLAPLLNAGQAAELINSPGAKVNSLAAGTRFTHFWSKCVGAGRANEGLRASWLKQLKTSRELCGFQYCRFHGLFHDDMFVYHEAGGTPVYNWQYIDDLFDRMLSIGVRPFVELSFMPKDLASTENTTFWWKAHSSPPKDYAKWGGLVNAFTQHCVERYGLQEVLQWYFEVWNEPDLHGFWDGTKSQYFELYKTSANAIKAIDHRLRVGGPATSNFVPDERFAGETEDKTKHKTLTVQDINTLEWRGVWIKDFLHYCSAESLPVDFISTHPYPTDWAIDPETKKGAGRTRKVNATKEDMQWLKKTIAESSYPHAEVHLTEWSSSPSSRDAGHDSLQAAAYIIKVNVDCIGLADSLSYWVFTDVFEEGGAGNSIFHGGFGLINYQGIVKPAFHAYRMLHALGDELLQQEEGLIVTRHSTTKKISALLYHYPAEMKTAIGSAVEKEFNTGSIKLFSLQLTGVKPGSGFIVETLDKDHGFGLAAWKAMGSPAFPTREQTAQLKQSAMALKKQSIRADAAGVLSWKRSLPPWTCVLITTTH